MPWTYFLSDIASWIDIHSTVAYLVVFLIALAESLALVGLVVPGTALMIIFGALVGSGHLAFPPTLIAAILGAIAGDGISYWLGRHYHQSIKNLWPFRSRPQLLLQGEEFFTRHGGKSVFFGRFLGPIRPVIPLIAGTLDMPVRFFVTVNVLSAIIWGFVYLLPGMLVGGSLTVIHAVSARLSLLLLLLILCAWLIFWLSKKLFILLKGLSPKSEQRMLLILCIVFILAGGLFLGVLEDVLTLDPLVRADQSIYQFLQSLRTPWANQILVAVTELGDSIMNLAFFLGLLVALLLKRLYRTALFWSAAAVGGGVLVQLFKWLVHKPRPILIYEGVSSWGFPSGHTTMSVVLFGFAAILLMPQLPLRRRWIPLATAIFASLLVAFSRLYLGAHWLSDVLGGLSLGWAWIALLSIFYLKGPRQTFRPRQLVIPLLLITLVCGGWHIASKHTQDLSRYQPRNTPTVVSLRDWQQDQWQQLPTWRIDLAGEKEQPLTLQYAGDLKPLADYLTQNGWAQNEGFSLSQLMNALTSSPPISLLPLLPQLSDGQREQLLMVMNQADSRLVLRFWDSGFQISDGRPLWVGSVVRQKAVSTAGLLTLSRAEKNFNQTRTLLQNILSGHFSLQRMDRDPVLGSDRKYWDRRVLLIWKDVI